MGLKLLLALLVVALAGAADESIILRDKEVIDALIQKSDPYIIPIDSKNPRPVTVEVKNSLLYVPAADEDAEVVELVVRQTLLWKNPLLTWSSRPDVDNVSFPVSEMWLPDTAPTNGVSSPEVLSPEIAVVSSEGDVTYIAQMRLGVYADLKELSSSKGAKVTIDIQSWTYDNSKFRFESPTPSSFALDEFESKRFKVSDPKVEKLTKWHPSKPSQYETLEFSFFLKKIETRE